MLVDFERVHGLWVGCVFIDVEDAWRDGVRGTKRFLKEGLGSGGIPFGAEEELDCLPVAIDSAVLLLPLAFDLDVRFVHAPGVVSRLEFGSAALL